jgi:23S rRNA (cytosine1962-C5)-methyltransferase
MEEFSLISPEKSSFYSLIDCGGFEKLERFGHIVTIRPEPQALWDKVLSEEEWLKRANVKYQGLTSQSGRWEKISFAPEYWDAEYYLGGKDVIRMNMALTSFKHVGLFPEQAANWEYIYRKIKQMKTPKPKFLNLFAYTGGASMAARRAGAEVTHVDSVKPIITWAKRNMENSGLDNIRWIVEDAVKFVKKEMRRERRYNGIILDPPAYGHGPNGESWKLEKNLNEMLKDVLEIMDREEHFLILNTYSLGFSALIIENMMRQNLKSYGFKEKETEHGELFLGSETGMRLPLGVFYRCANF